MTCMHKVCVRTIKANHGASKKVDVRERAQLCGSLRIKTKWTDRRRVRKDAEKSTLRRNCGSHRQAHIPSLTLFACPDPSSPPWNIIHAELGLENILGVHRTQVQHREQISSTSVFVGAFVMSYVWRG